MQNQSVHFPATHRHRFCSSRRRPTPSGPIGNAATGYAVRKGPRLLVVPSLLRPFPAHLSAAQLSAAHLDAAPLNAAQSALRGTRQIFSQQPMETSSKSSCGDRMSGGRDHAAALSAREPAAFPAPFSKYSTRILIKTLCSLMTHTATIRLQQRLPGILFSKCFSSSRSQVISHA